MKDLRKVASVDGERVAGSLSPREVAGGFIFPSLSFKNLIDVYDFK